MVKKQSTRYHRQVSLIVASAWPSPLGLQVSHSPAIPNWNGATVTTEYVQSEEEEAACERGKVLSPSGSLSLGYAWYSWLTWDWVSQRSDGVTVSEYFSVVFVGTRRNCSPPPLSGFFFFLRLHQPYQEPAPSFRYQGARVLLEIGLWCSQCGASEQSSRWK